ncbi:MAG TPA: glycosyltransferase family 2 protein [Leptolyngbyaceae cyanobacterium M33_DOE_097]|nr:glycosyltransferase family 2 protein [Leptolyngbyaceae cyanobacterium M33_DOE_097]
MTSNPLVSIIIPCFNAEKWLKETVDHCFQQSYRNIEIIIIDDGSKDDSLEIIKSFGDKVIWKTGPNRGGCHARNQGFSLAKGDYIQFLDADDVILPDKIKCQVECLKSSSADVVYSDWRYIYSFSWLADRTKKVECG